MNIVIINDNAQINGGGAKVAILSALDLASRGHNVSFLCAVPPVGPELAGNATISVYCSQQCEILTDPNRVRAFSQGWWNPKAEKLARRLFDSLDPEETVVHLHLWAKALSSSVVRAAILKGFPVVCTLHDFLLACPTGTLFNHPNGKICHLTPMSVACITSNCDTRSYRHKLWRVGRQAIQSRFGLLPGRIDDYIAHSSLVAELMKPYLPDYARIHRVPPFIQSEPREMASPHRHEGFVYLGRLVREKGVLMLARAAKAEKLGLTFVGSGDLANEIATANPDAQITGWVNQETGVEFLRKCRALVFPSLWHETLGLVVLEAASHGIASIVPDSSAAREIVIDGLTGLHFKGGDEQDLRRQMRRLHDPELARRLGEAAFHNFWASGYASGKLHSEALERVYLSMLQRKRLTGEQVSNPDREEGTLHVV